MPTRFIKQSGSYFVAIALFFIFTTIAHADLRNGLVGWWKLDQSSGNAIDSSGQNNTGTFTGTTFVSNCKRSGCRYFDGSSKVDLSTITFNTTYSVSAWVTCDSISGNLVAFTQRSSTPVAFQLDRNNADARFIVRDDAGALDVAGFTSVLTVGKWVHVVGIRNGNTLSIYVNGVKGTDGTAVTFGTLTTSGNWLQIGTYAGSASWTGMIDDVRIYNRALTAQEVNDLYLPGVMLRNGVVRNGQINK